MSPADKIAEAKALIPDAQEIAAERREKATESRAVAGMSGYAGRPAAGWLMAADYAERTANVLDRFAALTDLADAQAQEIARLKAIIAKMDANSARIVRDFYDPGVTLSEWAQRQYPELRPAIDAEATP